MPSGALALLVDKLTVVLGASGLKELSSVDFRSAGRELALTSRTFKWIEMPFSIAVATLALSL
jgi:hypothetical protein